MTDEIFSAARQHRTRRTASDFSTFLGLATVIVFFAASGFVSYWNTYVLSRNAQQVTHTHEVITTIKDIESLMKDAETGQRGYILSGNEKYLEPYTTAVANIEGRMTDLHGLVRDNPGQLERLVPMQKHIDAKLAELAQTIMLRKTKGFDTALAVVLSDRGKHEMDAFRMQAGAVLNVEKELRGKRILEMHDAYRIAVSSGIMACLLGIFLSCIVAYLIRRATVARQRQEWMQAGQVKLSQAMIGEQRLGQLGDNVLKFLAEYFDGHVGAIFTKEGGSFVRTASYGAANDSSMTDRFETGDSLLGQAAKDGRAFIVRDIPDGYITVTSAFTQGKPKHLLIAPVLSDGITNAVIELGFVHPLDDLALELLETVSESIGIAIKSANYRAHLQNLLEETQRQSEELQAQGEELRVSNEELEEQSRALKESQFRLEQQQAELEQTNSQLEEQAQLLEAQKDDLIRARDSVQTKAQELEQASQYKSDFLANMSHELRTPLNSSLILAKLLADNPQGNLTQEQVKFAHTIQSSGNDLLSLINDILDLSKIEAGHMDVRVEAVWLDRIASDLTRLFDPVAKQKGLTFKTSISGDCPDTIDSDRQRVEQILKNLLSNAIKFTEKGSVELDISANKDGSIVFAVTDTGIGIPHDKQQAIFDAFRQADGTISRKYGGTGLGLSISRELAKLLGGRIELSSESGKGSVFRITLPPTYNGPLSDARGYGDSGSSSSGKKAPISYQDQERPAPRTKLIEDDRDEISLGGRIILVVEDDESFARILYDLSHELNFQCLIAATAEDALILAKQYLPSAVVLDVGLPDNSGLSVLDRLKRDARTRHIPVHVISAKDHAQTALSLGAIGHMMKPVKRDELVEALKRLETTFAQNMRRVLIVEDDVVQRESMSKLLGSQDVETLGVGTAAECLEQLKEKTFDCMVLDLSLPDATGYSLLETLSREDAYSFPPVIVYTGRDLSGEEEQKLRRYSKSIIIKGVKSPERLLDEVTLFLHKVVSDLPAEQQKMLEKARNRDSVLEGRRILVVEDDVANVYALTSILEPRGAKIQIARNGKEALDAIEKSVKNAANTIDLVLMDMMMPEMDGLTATREIRKRKEWKKLPVIMLTAKAMKDDQERCLDAGANDYMAKPIDVDKLLSLIRVWMPR